VIRFVSVAVVVDEFPDVGGDDSDLGEDLVCGRGPGEGFRVLVPGVDVVVDLLDQDADAGEGTAADRLPGDDAEP
jgi:hypothetical protein